jgi:hypothetical protein
MQSCFWRDCIFYLFRELAGKGKFCRLWMSGATAYARFNMETKSAPSIRDLYPDFSEKELAAAEDNLERYLALVLRIYERVQTDPESYARFRALTEKIRAVSCKSSNPLPEANAHQLS